MKNGNNLLQLALGDKIRLNNKLCIVFVTEHKHPGLKKWQEYAKPDQSNSDIRKLYRKRGAANIGYSYYTGINGLIDIDFDWAWTYHVACRQFKDRMETRTFKTPNGGYRVLFITTKPNDFLNYKEKPPRVEIHGNKGHHVIVYGKFKDQMGNLKEYELVKDCDILEDNSIITDISNFLRIINEQCKFLEYNCIGSCLNGKINYLTQEQRTSVGAFFVAEKIDIQTAIDFFRTCEDFDKKITEDHLSRLYDKEFKHPTCEKLIEIFNWEENRCKSCIRRSGDKSYKKPESSTFGPDLTKINSSEIFSCIELGGKNHYIENIEETPIFEIGNKIHYVIPLTPIKYKTFENGKEKEELKKIIGLYGFKTGYGCDPLLLNTTDDHAIPMARISNVKHLDNKNQERIIEQSIKEELKTSKNLHKAAEFVYTDISVNEVEDIPCLLEDKFSYYIKLEDEIQYFIAVAFVIGTYMFPMFVTFGYLIISGEKGAGKGTFLDLMQKTCWNTTKKFIAPTEATLFRTIKEQLPTMIIDEYHRSVNNAGTGLAMGAIIESGYEKGGTVPRTEKFTTYEGTEYRVVNYPVYCPKILATRKPVEADDKGIKIIVPKMVMDETYAKRKKEMISDPLFETVRKDLLNWVLMNQDDVMVSYNSIEPTAKLSGREFNVWLPILSIASIAFPEKYERIVKYAEETITKNRTNIDEKENRVLTALYMLCKDNVLKSGGKKIKEDSYIVSNLQIKNKIYSIEGEKIHHNTIKSALENMKLSSYTQPGQYYISKNRLKKLFSERGLNEINLKDIGEQNQKSEIMKNSFSILTDYGVD